MKRIVSITMVFLILMSSLAFAANSTETANIHKDKQKATVYMKHTHIKSVTAITEVFGDGQKVTAVAMEYDKDIDNSTLTKSTFSVNGRTVTKVYANTAPAKAAQGVNGKYAIIELSTNDKNAYTIAQNSGEKPSNNSGNDQNAKGPSLGGSSANSKSEVKVSVTQTSDIVTTDRNKYIATSNVLINDKAISLIVDDFKQLEFKDPKNGKILKYNLFTPKNYDKNKSYPMVMFIHDAGATSTETDMTLIQGLGAVIWATPEEQAKHESFVLAPEYPSVVVDDTSTATNDLDVTVDLINSLESQYSIDKNRLYTTGQSMGCMSSIALNIKYPDLFAASLLVAGQWDPTVVSPLAKDKLWIIVSEGDDKAYPGMNAITDTLEKEGAKVSRATWNGQATAAEFASDVSKMIAEGSNINYIALKKGTVVPSNQLGVGGSDHRCTWWIAYTIEGVRDWLFTQVKTPKP